MSLETLETMTRGQKGQLPRNGNVYSQKNILSLKNVIISGF